MTMASSRESRQGDGVLAFSGFLFDMDGLLLDSERIAKEGFARSCRYFGIGNREALFHRLIGIKWERAVEILHDALSAEVDASAFSDYWDADYHRNTSDKPVPLKPGVSKLLDILSREGRPMAVATSTRHASAVNKLSRSGILGYFQRVIGGDEVREGKPHPEIYLKAARALDCDPRDCLAFEDSERGTRAALASGATVVQVPDLLPPSEELLQLGPVVLGKIDDVLDYPFPARR